MGRTRFIIALSFFCSFGLFSQFSHYKLPKASSLRGISAYSEDVCWVSGSMGAVFKTSDAGKSWVEVSPPGFDSLQFRDIEVFHPDTVLIMSSGSPTYILKTFDGGQSWNVVYKNTDEAVFLDAMDFWDQEEGLVFGDAIDKDLFLLKTRDQGMHWERIDTSLLPNVLPGQGGFAASGTCLKVIDPESAILGLGGPNADMLITRDRGKSWTRKSSPISAGEASSGIFSFDFLNGDLGLCAGGNYLGDSLSERCLAITRDGGASWNLILHPAVDGFYHSSCLVLNNDTMLTMSRFGSSWSYDGGVSWKRQAEACFSMSRFPGGFWASGPEGHIVKWKSHP